MARRKGLSAKQLAALPRRATRYLYPDPVVPGLYWRISPTGPPIATVVVKKNRKQKWVRLGPADELTPEEIRDRARAVIKRIKSGVSPPPPPQSVAAVTDNWLTRHVDKNKLRSAHELRRLGGVIVKHIGDRDFACLRRSDIVAFLDVIEDRHGPATADAVLSTLRSIASFEQRRSDDYVPPFTRGMRRVPAHQRQRQRVLSDSELQIVWHAAGSAGVLGDMIKLLLLTGQRREKIYTLKWSDIRDGVWTVPHTAGEKGVGGRLRLPPLALGIIANQARVSDFVFPHRPSSPTKTHFDRRCGVHFRLHDLRRTSRTLLSRIGVSYEVAESLLGHRVGSAVASVYDRYDREAEKGIALAKLAATIQQIVDPVDNVVALHEVVS
jgi:integrase